MNFTKLFKILKLLNLHDSATCGSKGFRTKSRECFCPPGVDENICGCGELTKTKKCENMDECPPGDALCRFLLFLVSQNHFI